jgi:hypothetical protein
MEGQNDRWAKIGPTSGAFWACRDLEHPDPFHGDERPADDHLIENWQQSIDMHLVVDDFNSTLDCRSCERRDIDIIAVARRPGVHHDNCNTHRDPRRDPRCLAR